MFFWVSNPAPHVSPEGGFPSCNERGGVDGCYRNIYLCMNVNIHVYIYMYIHLHVYVYMHMYIYMYYIYTYMNRCHIHIKYNVYSRRTAALQSTYGVASSSRLLKIIGLFRKRDLQNDIFSTETCNFKEPTSLFHTFFLLCIC